MNSRLENRIPPWALPYWCRLTASDGRHESEMGPKRSSQSAQQLAALPGWEREAGAPEGGTGCGPQAPAITRERGLERMKLGATSKVLCTRLA